MGLKYECPGDHLRIKDALKSDQNGIEITTLIS